MLPFALANWRLIIWLIMAILLLGFPSVPIALGLLFATYLVALS